MTAVKQELLKAVREVFSHEGVILEQEKRKYIDELKEKYLQDYPVFIEKLKLFMGILLREDARSLPEGHTWSQGIDDMLTPDNIFSSRTIDDVLRCFDIEKIDVSEISKRLGINLGFSRDQNENLLHNPIVVSNNLRLLLQALQIKGDKDSYSVYESTRLARPSLSERDAMDEQILKGARFAVGNMLYMNALSIPNFMAKIEENQVVIRNSEDEMTYSVIYDMNSGNLSLEFSGSVSLSFCKSVFKGYKAIGTISYGKKDLIVHFGDADGFSYSSIPEVENAAIEEWRKRIQDTTELESLADDIQVKSGKRRTGEKALTIGARKIARIQEAIANAVLANLRDDYISFKIALHAEGYYAQLGYSGETTGTKVQIEGSATLRSKDFNQAILPFFDN